jgi:hypothetical protein
MANEVYANGMEIACKAAAGKSAAAFPDTCLSPPSPPAGPVPIPYPNTAFASDTTKGTTTVMISGQEVMMKDQSTFKKSIGDEAATKSLGMGVVTHTIQGEASFVAWSMDVKFEGANVDRHLDLMLHNEQCDPANTPPYIYVDGMVAGLPPKVCDDLGKTLDATITEELPPSLTDGATVAVGFNVPPGGPPTMVGGASSISSSKIMRGGKYAHYSKGIKRGEASKATQCGGTEPFQYKDQAQPYEGHAEAKIIEDFFAAGGQGTLVLKISRAPCPQCDKLIRHVNENAGSGPDCNKVFVCP